jgi:hypothetical protein
MSGGGDIGAGGASEMGAVARKQVRAWSDNLRDGGGCPTKGGGSHKGRSGENVVTWEEASRVTVRTRHRSSSLNRVLGTKRAGSGDAGGAGDGTVPDVSERWEQVARSAHKLPAQARGRGTGGFGVGKGVEMRERLVALLDERGSYPADRRVEIWQKLLQVPEDAPKQLALSYTPQPLVPHCRARENTTNSLRAACKHMAGASSQHCGCCTSVATNFEPTTAAAAACVRAAQRPR